ncbi:MAG: GNAT family protein [Clostridiaceae bacterium]
MEEFKSISTERLEIRMITAKDNKKFFKYRSLPEVFKYQSFQPTSIEDVDNFIASNESFINIPDSWIQLGIYLKGTERLIGDIGLHFLDDISQVEIGYTLDPLFQGKGYALEAVKALMTYLFKELHKHRITASVDPENEKSVHLLEKLGMRKEAHFMKSYLIDDEYYDDCIYAILREEFNEG